MRRFGGSAARLGVFLVVAVAAFGVARWVHASTWYETSGEVTFRPTPDSVEVAYVDPEGIEREASAVSELAAVDGTGNRRTPSVGETVPVLVSRDAPDTIRVVEPPIAGLDPEATVIALIVVAIAAALAIAPEFIRVSEPEQVREDRGFYWRT